MIIISTRIVGSGYNLQNSILYNLGILCENTDHLPTSIVNEMQPVTIEKINEVLDKYFPKEIKVTY